VTLLAPQTQADTGHPEEPGLAGTTKDHIPAEVSVGAQDRIPEPQVDLKGRDLRRLNLRFRRRKESPASKGGVAIGKTA
jgi:hypothetical protein